MSRYEYDSNKVASGLNALSEASNVMDSFPDEFRQGVNAFKNARGANYIQADSDLNAVYEYANGVLDMIANLDTEIKSKEQQIVDYEQAPWYKKAFSTLGMGALKLVEGIGSFFEGIVDGGATLVGYVGGLFSSDFQNAVGEFVKKDYVGDFFYNQYENGALKGINDYSIMSHTSTAANILKGVGTAIPSIALTACGVPMAPAVIANGLSATGQKQQQQMLQGKTFKEAFGTSLKAGLVAAGETYVFKKLAGTDGGGARNNAFGNVKNKTAQGASSGLKNAGTTLTSTGELAALDGAKGATLLTRAGGALSKAGTFLSNHKIINGALTAAAYAAPVLTATKEGILNANLSTLEHTGVLPAMREQMNATTQDGQAFDQTDSDGNTRSIDKGGVVLDSPTLTTEPSDPAFTDASSSNAIDASTEGTPTITTNQSTQGQGVNSSGEQTSPISTSVASHPTLPSSNGTSGGGNNNASGNNGGNNNTGGNGTTATVTVASPTKPSLPSGDNNTTTNSGGNNGGTQTVTLNQSTKPNLPNNTTNNNNGSNTGGGTQTVTLTSPTKPSLPNNNNNNNNNNGNSTTTTQTITPNIVGKITLPNPTVTPSHNSSTGGNRTNGVSTGGNSGGISGGSGGSGSATPLVTGSGTLNLGTPTNLSTPASTLTVTTPTIKGNSGSLSDMLNATSRVNVPKTADEIVPSTVEKVTTKKSMIPAVAGLGAASIAGIGAKAYLDRKDDEDEEEEELGVQTWEENQPQVEETEERDYLNPEDEYAFQE